MSPWMIARVDSSPCAIGSTRMLDVREIAGLAYKPSLVYWS